MIIDSHIGANTWRASRNVRRKGRARTYNVSGCTWVEGELVYVCWLALGSVRVALDEVTRTSNCSTCTKYAIINASISGLEQM